MMWPPKTRRVLPYQWARPIRAHREIRWLLQNRWWWIVLKLQMLPSVWSLGPVLHILDRRYARFMASLSFGLGPFHATLSLSRSA